jgi:hypothetical protein
MALAIMPQQPARTVMADSVYASERVRAVVTSAAAMNAAPPASLRSYRARVETELSFVQSQADGRETPLQLEQIASDLYWRADGGITQEIIGYRAQTLGASFSGLSFFEVPFLIPSLFADRLDLVRTTGPVRSETGQLLRRRTIHPFAAGRDAVYAFSGGDTVDVIHLPKRVISIVRVHVVPRREPSRPTLLFEGDIDVDADRFHIVRMTGRLIATGRGTSFLSNFLQGVLYVKLENAEYDQEYWLPREQRFEAQAVSRIGDARTTFRTVSRVVDLVTNDSTAMVLAANPDSFPYGRMIMGDMGVLSRFRDWSAPIGSLSETADAHDFDMYAPASLRPGTQSRLTFGARYVSQLIRINPVEGLYTGGGLVYRITDHAALRAHAGYAWSEQTARGGVELANRSKNWETRIRAERQLAHTADFVSAFQPDPGVTPLIVGDQYDFMDRRIASVIVQHPSNLGTALRLEAGRASDRNVQRHILDQNDSLSLTGRGDEGSYWIGRAQLQHNASAGAQSLQPGAGWMLRYEGGAGELAWQRFDAGASLRRVAGPFTMATRVDAGVLFSDAPPAQTLFDFTNTATLPGYSGDRVFAGDRTALARGMVMYSPPFLRSPIHLGSLYLPALAPSPSVGLYAGWTDARTQTLPTLQRLGWETTNGVRASVDLRLRFFGGAVSAGAARPLEQGGEWKFVWGWINEF